MTPKRSLFALVLALLAGGTAMSCGSGLAPCAGNVCVVGTMHYYNLEGGFWAIRGDDSVTYDPMTPLSDEFKREGLRVQLDARARRDMGSVHMAGPVVEVIALRKID